MAQGCFQAVDGERPRPNTLSPHYPPYYSYPAIFATFSTQISTTAKTGGFLRGQSGTFCFNNFETSETSKWPFHLFLHFADFSGHSLALQLNDGIPISKRTFRLVKFLLTLVSKLYFEPGRSDVSFVPCRLIAPMVISLVCLLHRPRRLFQSTHWSFQRAKERNLKVQQYLELQNGKKCLQENENIVLWEIFFLGGMKIHSWEDRKYIFEKEWKYISLQQWNTFIDKNGNIFLDGDEHKFLGGNEKWTPPTKAADSRENSVPQSYNPFFKRPSHLSKHFKDLFLESERSAYEEKNPDISLINQCDWSTQAKRLSLSSIYI